MNIIEPKTVNPKHPADALEAAGFHLTGTLTGRWTAKKPYRRPSRFARLKSWIAKLLTKAPTVTCIKSEHPHLFTTGKKYRTVEAAHGAPRVVDNKGNSQFIGRSKLYITSQYHNLITTIFR